MKLGTVLVKSTPEVGDYRIQKKFAWFPRVVQGQWIWLEEYKKVFEYRFRERPFFVGHRAFWLPCEDWDLITEQLEV